jgi:hypothetical protein
LGFNNPDELKTFVTTWNQIDTKLIFKDYLPKQVDPTKRDKTNVSKLIDTLKQFYSSKVIPTIKEKEEEKKENIKQSAPYYLLIYSLTLLGFDDNRELQTFLTSWKKIDKKQVFIDHLPKKTERNKNKLIAPNLLNLLKLYYSSKMPPSLDPMLHSIMKNAIFLLLQTNSLELNRFGSEWNKLSPPHLQIPNSIIDPQHENYIQPLSSVSRFKLALLKEPKDMRDDKSPSFNPYSSFSNLFSTSNSFILFIKTMAFVAFAIPTPKELTQRICSYQLFYNDFTDQYFNHHSFNNSMKPIKFEAGIYNYSEYQGKYRENNVWDISITFEIDDNQSQNIADFGQSFENDSFERYYARYANAVFQDSTFLPIPEFIISNQVIKEYPHYILHFKRSIFGCFFSNITFPYIGVLYNTLSTNNSVID